MEVNEETADIVVMAQSIQGEIEAAAHFKLEKMFGDLFDANDGITQSVRTDALRFKRWYYWRHTYNHEQLVIMMARMSVTFLRAEEEWVKNWLEVETPKYLGKNFINQRIREILKQSQNLAATASTSGAVFSDKYFGAHILQPRPPPLKGVCINELVAKKPAALNITEGKGKARMEEADSHSTHSSPEREKAAKTSIGPSTPASLALKEIGETAKNTSFQHSQFKGSRNN